MIDESTASFLRSTDPPTLPWEGGSCPLLGETVNQLDTEIATWLSHKLNKNPLLRKRFRPELHKRELCYVVSSAFQVPPVPPIWITITQGKDTGLSYTVLITQEETTIVRERWHADVDAGDPMTLIKDTISKSLRFLSRQILVASPSLKLYCQSVIDRRKRAASASRGP